MNKVTFLSCNQFHFISRCFILFHLYQSKIKRGIINI
nr:MAG TPA: hypothetical protein [Bacteriophage sp.]